MMNKERFVGYEYTDVLVKKSYILLYEDAYENFGWQLESEKQNAQHVGSTTLTFKRDRKMRNKSELTRLQRQFDAIVEQIDFLERKKKLKAVIVSYVVGVIGCAFIAVSVMAISMDTNTSLMIAAAIPGILLWILSYPTYAKISNNKIKELSPLIEDKYDEVYEVTKRANALLSV